MKNYTFFTLILFLLFAFGCKKDEEAGPVNLPQLGITSISNLTSKSLFANSTLIDNGNSEITEKGFVWDIEKNPTIDNNNYTSSSSSTNYFKCYVNNLIPNHQYYIRSYAKNKAGIAYGDETSFITEHNVYTGDMTLESQTEVDAIAKEQYTKIKGSLVIGPTSTITSLEKLAGLTQISGKLEIYYVTNLANLEGLESLTSVANLYIYNTELENINALSNLISIYGTWYASQIGANPNITNIDCLENITSIKGISLWENKNLENIDGLKNITSISSISISDNDKLLNVDGLLNISSLDYLGIHSNSGLQNLNGLNNLTSVDRTIEIMNNSSLPNLDGLNNLQSVKNFRVEDNIVLNDYCGLSSNLYTNPAIIFNISGNAYNPSITNLINGNCSK